MATVYEPIKLVLVACCPQTGRGLTFALLHDGHNGMAKAMIIMAAEWPVLLALAWYLGQVLPSGGVTCQKCCCIGLQGADTCYHLTHISHACIEYDILSVALTDSGVRKHPLFFLKGCLPVRGCPSARVSDASDLQHPEAASVWVSSLNA